MIRAARCARKLRTLMIVFGVIGWPGTAHAAMSDTVADTAVKAAFLYNFAKFAAWPNLAPAEPLALCVVGDDRVAAALSDTVKGQTVDGHRLDVRRVAADASAQGCHVLFLGTADARRGAVLVHEARGHAVLTVSDADRFAASGGMIEFFPENGRMRFAVNVDAMQRAGLQLSSRVLTLAKIVRDDRAQ